jgi:hypothetical protein
MLLRGFRQWAGLALSKVGRRGQEVLSALGHEDARIADDAAGPLLAQVPPCLRNRTASIKVVDPARLGDAVRYIESLCSLKDCVVYSAFPGVKSAAFRVES